MTFESHIQCSITSPDVGTPPYVHRHPSERARLHGQLHASVIVAMRMPHAHGPAPTVCTAIWSPTDRTVHRTNGYIFPPDREYRSEPRTASEGVHARPLMRSAVSHFRLHPAHQPGRMGAGAGSVLTWPHWAAALARRPCLSCIVSRQP